VDVAPPKRWKIGTRRNVIINPYRFTAASGGGITRLDVETFNGAETVETTLQHSITVDASANFLLIAVVNIAGNSEAPTSIGINGGTSATEIVSDDNGANISSYSLWHIANPETGSQTLDVVYSSAPFEYVVVVIEYSGIDTTDPVESTVTPTYTNQPRNCVATISWNVSANDTVGVLVLDEYTVVSADVVLCGSYDGTLIAQEKNSEQSVGVADHVAESVAAEIRLASDTTNTADNGYYMGVVLNGAS
jgi:hypothetical protein